MRFNKKSPLKSDKTQALRAHKRGVVGYSRKSALLEEAITQMNAGKYGRSSTALKELLALDPQNMEARRLFATLHLRLGSLIPARQAFDSLISEAFQRQDYWLAESLLREYLVAGPRCVPFLEKLGTLYQEKGDTLEAVTEFGKAVDILIEDPDPDQPDHVSQLYEKIRKLAPASPVAFRLASFFDAQTGELLVRQPADSDSSTDVPPLGMPESGPDVLAGLEPVDGVMPWEVRDSQVTAPDSSHVVTVSDSADSLIQPTVTDYPTHQEHQHDVELRLPDPPVQEQEQAVSSTSEVGSTAAGESRTDEGVSAHLGSQLDDLSGQVGLVAPHLLVSPLRSVGHDGVPLERDGELVETELEMSCDASGPSMGIVPIDSRIAPEAPISSIQLAEDLSALSSSQVEEMPAPSVENSETPSVSDPSNSMAPTGGPIQSWEQNAWVAEAESRGADNASDLLTVVVQTEPTTETEPTIVGPIQVEDRQPSLLQRLETESKEVVTEQPSGTRALSSPEPVSGNEMSEPWKQPGFSWESVFNSAWKFGSDRSVQAVPSERTETNVGESSPPAPVTVPHQEQLSDDQTIEIPEREASTLLGDQISAGSPIAPMPWDHVQESVLSILPTPVDPPMTESLTLEDEPEFSQTAGESQAHSPSSPDISVEETDSFSIARAPQTPVSPEQEISVADVEPTAFKTEQASAQAESESVFRVVSAPIMDKPPLEVPAAALPAPVFESESVADTVIAPSEVLPKSADSLLSAEDDGVITAVQSHVQESTSEPLVARLQPNNETLIKKTDESPPFSALRTQERIGELPPARATAPHLAEEAAEVAAHEQPPQAMTFVEAHTPHPEPAPEPVSKEEDWVKAGESIRFIEPSDAASIVEVPQASSERQGVSRSTSVAAAVDVLFESSQQVRATEARGPAAESPPKRKTSSTLVRIRLTIADFIGSCFSTTRAVVVTGIGLVMLSGVLIALGIGAMGVTWIVMEESPSPVFQSLTTTPQRALSDFKKNGYLFLLGFEASDDHDPIQTGYDRKPATHDSRSALACVGGSESKTSEESNTSANVMRGWVRSPDPVGMFKSQHQTIREWGAQHASALNRYSQWKKLPFEDWGYGQTVSPPCSAMVFAHQLHVADGFLQDVALGIDRLETDMEAWRIVLSQAKTLPVKMLAVQAINDDIAIASGLLVGSDFDGKYLGRVANVLRPLDQEELSMRWPMQSELVSASKTYETQLKTARAKEQPMYTMVASALPLPMQRRLNDYAEYYDASYKAAGEGQYGALPKRKNYIQFPASGLTDYVTNPIENIVGLEPLAPWDLYNGFVVDTDARLRLASLQAWLRHSPPDGALATQIAKAGQSLYDPYTGLPMLLNMKKGALYSVGHDGKDQDADPQSDVVVQIPVGHTSATSAKSSAVSSHSR